MKPSTGSKSYYLQSVTSVDEYDDKDHYYSGWVWAWIIGIACSLSVYLGIIWGIFYLIRQLK